MIPERFQEKDSSLVLVLVPASMGAWPPSQAFPSLFILRVCMLLGGGAMLEGGGEGKLERRGAAGGGGQAGRREEAWRVGIIAQSDD